MDWESDRRLVFAATEDWRGWFCERCCWNRPQPATPKEREAQATRIAREFATHDCEQFAAEHWHKPSN